MVDVHGEITIDRPRDEVFDFVANEENEPRYNPQMRLIEKLTDGPIGVGTCFRAEMAGRGRVVPMTIEFTEVDRPHRLAERVHMEAMDLTGGLTFESVDGATRMRWAWDLSPRGVLRFVSPLVAEMGRRRERKIWTSLKRLLEATRARTANEHEDGRTESSGC
jgi:uncharacterized protein YndB with AHSA1/START domain